MAGPYESNAVRRSGPYAESGSPTGPRGPYSTQDAEERGPSSLFRQFTGLVGAMPAGIAHMGADLAQDTYALTQLPSAMSLAALANLPGGAGVVEGIHRNRAIRPFVGEEIVTNAAQGGMGFSDNMRATMPFMASMGTSMRGTGERVVNQTAALAPGGLAAGEGAYARASREGNILPVVVEDIGNAAIVTSGISRGLARAAEPAVARSQVAEAAARATAPLETGGATAARSAVTPSSGQAARGLARRGIRPTLRDLAREEAVATSPGDALVAEAMRGPQARVFEVGGAGPAATRQVVDDAGAAVARAEADAIAARALRLQRAARRTHNLARLGDTLADSPAAVWTKPVGMVARGINPAVTAIGETDLGGRIFAGVDNTVGQAVRNQRARAEFRRFIHEEGELPKVEGAGEIRQTAIAAERLLEDPIEGYAGHLVVSGIADALGPTIRSIQGDLAAQLGVDEAVARRWAIDESFGDIEKPEGFDPADAFELADRYARTRAYNALYRQTVDAGEPAPPRPPDLMPPEQMARIDEAQRLLQEGIREGRESRYFRGWGESKGPRPEEEAARVTQEMLDRGAGPREVSAASEAAAAAARQREADVLAGRTEQRGSEPLSVVVRKATERFAPKIDAAIDRVVEAQTRAGKADERRLVPADEFDKSVRERVMDLYAQAQDIARTIVATDPYLARAVANPDPRITVSDDALVDLVAGRLVSARGSRNPELRQLMADLKDAGWEMPFDLPNPATLLPAERRAANAERARIFARQAQADEGTAATAQRQLEDWQAKPQPIVEPRPGFSSSLEARTRAADAAQARAASGPNVPDVDLAVRDRRRAAAAEAMGVPVRPGEPFRVPREKVTGEAAMPQPLQSYTDADGNVHDGMLVELDMRGATLHPQVGGVSEVTPGRFMPNERVFLAYGDEGRAIGYLAVYGDTGLSIAVDPEARGQGVGVRLYEAAEAAGIDVHRNLADETFTLEGARTYERFVNGPAEAERVTFDRPVQREVFDRTAAAETAAETRDRVARQGQQQEMPVEAARPEAPPAGPWMETGAGEDIGPPPPGTAPGTYVYDLESGELRPLREGETIRTPNGTDVGGMPDYWSSIGNHDSEPGVFDGGEAARERFIRAHPDLPFDAEEQNIRDEWAAKPPERSVRVRVTPALWEDIIDKREMPTSYDGPANAYLKIEEAGQGPVNLTEAEARELYEDAKANADEYGANEGNRGMLQAYTLLAAQLKRVLDNGDAVTRQDADKLFTKPQARAVQHVVETSHEGWPADGSPGIPVDQLRASIDAQIQIHVDNKADGNLTREGTRELKALENAKAKLDEAYPPPARPTLDPGQVDRMVFNATIHRHFEDIYGRGERPDATPNAREIEVTVHPPREAPAVETPAADEPIMEGEFSPELNQRLDQHLAEFETAGRDALYELEGEWESKFGEADFLEFLPRQAFVAGDAQRVPTEWEWFVALPPATQKMIRQRYMAPDPAADARRVAKGYPRDPRVGTGSNPDEVAQFYRSRELGGSNANVDYTVEEAMAEYVRMIETRDALEHVTNPRSRATDAEIEMAAERMGMDPAVLKALRTTEGGRSRRAMLERLAQVAADEYAVDALGPEPQPARGGRQSPWEMDVEAYIAELTSVEATLAAWAEQHPVNDTGDFDDFMEPPEVLAARERIHELAPTEFDDFDAPVAADALHARILDAARKHGLAEGPVDEPSRVFDPIARGAEAVADVEQRALEAFIEDVENRRMYRSSGQTLPREDYLYHTLDEPGRRIYRQMVADTKVLTEQQRLELARRQLGQKLIARGRKAQAPLSRQEGRLVARERILTTRAEQSSRRAEKAAERLDESPRYEARTEAMGRTLGTFGRGQRKVGVREGEARAREVDLGQAERTLINLLDRQARAEMEARLSPEAAPARFASLLRAGGNLKAAIDGFAQVLDETSEDGRGGDVLRTLTLGIPQNVQAATRLVGDAADPEFLIGGDWGRRKSGASLGRLDEALPYVRKGGQERVKSRTEGGTDFTIRGQAIEEIKRYTDGVRNNVARRVQEKFGVRPDDLGVELRGRELVDEMLARDFVPWDPANPLLTPPPSQVTGQTTFIPRQLMIAFKKSSFGEKPRWQQNLETWYDRRFLGTIKTFWLALSPRWQLGNLVGNSLMAVIGGGVDPITLVKQMRNARALLAEDPTGELLSRQQHLLANRGSIPRTLLNRGMTHEEMTFLNPDLERPVRNPVARLAQKSYAVNEFTDNMFRSAVYLAKLEPRAQLWDDLDAGRISPQEFMGRVGNTQSAQAALDGALHAAGDFQNMTPFERNVIKRLWIFYPWYRHITRLALSLPVNHPTRVIWTLHIAQVFGDVDEQEDLPPFLQGSIPLGGDRYLRTGALNPFGGVQDSPLLSPGSAVAGLTPAITWPAAVLMGVDLSRGGAPISRPPGTEKLDAYGRPTNTPLWRNPGELFRYAANQFPQGRAAYGALEEPVLRYGQGSPVLVQGETIPTGSSRWSAGARLFGIPMPESIDVESINRRRQERLAAAATSRERYNENLNRAGAGR